jgi:hypothetical protein
MKAVRNRDIALPKSQKRDAKAQRSRKNAKTDEDFAALPDAERKDVERRQDIESRRSSSISPGAISGSLSSSDSPVLGFLCAPASLPLYVLSSFEAEA